MKDVLAEYKARAAEMLASNAIDINVPDHPGNTLIFRKPKTTDCFMRFTILGGGTLVVTGDLGDAVYQWHGDPRISFRWLSGLDLSYFVSKCRASEVGSRFEEWNEQAARSRFAEWKRDLPQDSRKRVSKMFEEEGGDSAFGDRFEWNRFADASLRLVWEDLDGLIDIGMVTAFRAVCHWTAIRLIGQELEP